MAITLERYLAVCKPFYRITREWSSRIFIIPIILISVIYNLPHFFEIQTCENHDVYTTEQFYTTINRTMSCPGSIFQDDFVVSKLMTMPQNKTFLQTILPNPVLLQDVLQNKTVDIHSLYVNFTNLRLDKTYHLYRTCSNFLINAAVPFVFIFILNAKILHGLKNRYLQTTGDADTANNHQGNRISFQRVHYIYEIVLLQM